MVISSLGRGGAERQLTRLAIALSERNASIRVFVKHAGLPAFDTFREELTRASIPVSEIPLGRTFGVDGFDLPAVDCSTFTLVRGLCRLFDDERPEVVHGWMDELGVAGALAGLYCGARRVVIDLRGFNPTWFDSRGLGSIRAAMRVLASRDDVHFVSNSEAGARDYEQWLGLELRHLTVIRNAIDVHGLDCEPSTLKAFRSSRGAEGDLLVGGIMRLTWEKDPILWVQSAAAACRRDPRFRFVLFGDGPLSKTVRTLIDQFGLADRIELPGQLLDRGAALRAIDALLVTSHVEGTPNVVLEAQFVGTRVVALDVGGIRECFAPSMRQFLIGSRNPEAIADVLVEATSAPKKDVNLTDFVAREFSQQTQIEAYRRVYGTDATATPSVE
jgi:glycosyltransferase involved in cell wall biosynthesis